MGFKVSIASLDYILEVDRSQQLKVLKTKGHATTADIITIIQTAK